jgi:hypothetical protein
VRGDLLALDALSDDDPETSQQIQAQATLLARGLARERLPLRLCLEPALRDGHWSVAVVLSPGLDPAKLAAAVRAENLLCQAGPEPDQICLPLSPTWSPDDLEQLVLALTKVMYYLS